MSSGHEVEGMTTLVTVDQDEFNEVLKRVHNLLMNRVNKALTKKESQPTSKNIVRHIETVKDVYALVHMMELVEYMSKEISDLREVIQLEGIVLESDREQSPEMFVQKKTKFMN